jgi:two-component system, NtrC family, sensor kinase
LQHRLKSATIRIDNAEYDRPQIELIKDYGDLPFVDCYAGQLNQVFMNLLSNAIDALEENSQSCRLVADARKAAGTACQWEGEKPAEIRICTKVLDDRIAVGIGDNGPGMPESVKAKIFDPFFTTKPIGKGTGMGLSISYQIITEKHNGTLRCESQIGQGTQFWLEIPLRSAQVSSSDGKDTFHQLTRQL